MRHIVLSGVSDAASRHLEEVATDIRGLLGPGIELDQLAIEGADPDSVTLRAQYRLAGVLGQSLGRGSNVIDAHAELRRAIVEDRVALGFRVLV